MRAAVITGVSRGLGEALFTQLHARGDRVVGIGRNFTPAQGALAASDPDRVVLHRADLTEPSSVPDSEQLGRLLGDATEAVLIHNAGMVEPIGAVGGLPADQLAATVAVNLTAPMLLTNSFLGWLPATTTATILFISSGAARRTIDGWAVYSTTKRAGEAFFEAVAGQVADEPRITVVSVNPGVMDTDMQAVIREAAAGPEWFPERDRFVALHANGELPDPAEVARGIVRDHLAPAE
jgi:benzil reductase ((S)-benzoin forming)